MSSAVRHLPGPRDVRRGYEGGEHRPLGGYLAALGGYAAGVGALACAAMLRGRRLPDRYDLGDAVLLSVATHKISRLVAKDAVTSPRLTRAVGIVMTAVAVSDTLQLVYDTAKRLPSTPPDPT
ncbi:MAG TPA: hypothetical protein VHV74_26180 [Pseudonocardiaceae bacterium]|nr:hypothetical protein [Pseudonocardiaceae bacterium]